jgi:hypothetical protein
VKRRWDKQRARQAASAAPSADDEFSLDDVRRVGVLAIQEFERRLSSGRPLSDTALSRAVGQLVQLLEAQEQRRREAAKAIDAAAAVAADDGFLGTLNANREHPEISRIVGEYRVGMEALLSRVREFEAEVAS